jgi:type II secretory pathway pseudopilin PulG
MMGRYFKNGRSRLPLSPSQKGYLLIEALVAMAIFSIGFLAVGKMIIFTTHNNTRSNIMTQATLLATKTLEDFKSTAEISTLVIGEGFNDGGPVDAHGNPGGIFSRSWSVKDPVGFNTSRQIEVTVRWTRRGLSRRIDLTTLTRGKGT